MRNIFLIVLTAFVSGQVFGAVIDPSICSAQQLSAYSQKVLDEALLKGGTERRELIISALLKIRDLCDIQDNSSTLQEYLPVKIHGDIEIALDVEAQYPSHDGGFVAKTLSNIRN